MKQISRLLIIGLVIISCNENKSVIEVVDFRRDYKFSSEIEEKIASDTVPWRFQISASDYATKGDYKNALIQWDLAMGGGEKNFDESQIDSINFKYSKIEASNYIIEQAKNNKVVIINEAHHNSFHRFFTKSLLEDLYKIGYRHLGLEALSSGKSADTLLNKRGYPIKKTGYYIKDPQFGSLVREAIKMGYHIFSYEQTTGSNGKPREIEQARNIQKVIEANPKGKFLIHCGFDHVLEGTHKSWGKAMAGRLTEYTGINPLTINQVVYSEKGNPSYNHPLLKALDIEDSSIIINKKNEPLGYQRGDAWTDIAVFHPNTAYKNNRPDWLFKNENQHSPISLTAVEIDFPVMVLAFKKGEDINEAIPIDIIEVKNKTDNCSLGLEKGAYEIVVTNGKESIKFEQKVK